MISASFVTNEPLLQFLKACTVFSQKRAFQKWTGESFFSSGLPEPPENSGVEDGKVLADYFIDNEKHFAHIQRQIFTTKKWLVSVTLLLTSY